MERDPIKNDARSARRSRRLGPDAACALCGVTDPEALTLVDKTLIEWHHAGGRAHDDALTVPLCLNCHRVATEGQMRAGLDFTPQGTLPERLLHWLRSVADFLRNLAVSVEQFAAWLGAFIAGLDRDYPGWRGKGWAQA